MNDELIEAAEAIRTAMQGWLDEFDSEPRGAENAQERALMAAGLQVISSMGCFGSGGGPQPPKC